MTPDLHAPTIRGAAPPEVPPGALPPGVELARRYRILELVGVGGMGVVYRARDVSLGRDVALKTLPQLSAVAAERLMTEARTMASLSHEDVAVVYGVEQWRGTPLLVMEYLGGGTLLQRLRRGRLEDGEAAIAGKELPALGLHLDESAAASIEIERRQDEGEADQGHRGEKAGQPPAALDPDRQDNGQDADDAGDIAMAGLEKHSAGHIGDHLAVGERPIGNGQPGFLAGDGGTCNDQQ